MNFKTLTALSLLTLFAASNCAYADTTVIETTTTEPAYVVPTSSKTVVINPTTNKVVEEYTTTTSVPTGYYVAEVDSGKILAVSQAEGRLVAYRTSDFAVQRSLIDHRISEEFDEGRLTTDQVEDLREDLVKIANFEVKKRKDGHLSESNCKKVERKINDLLSELNEDIADTNERRARLGLKVD